MVRVRYIGPKAILALIVAAVMTAALAPGCLAAAKGSDAPGGSAAERTVASLRKLSHSLAQQIADLEARTSSLEASQPRPPAPISMIAGGDLTGTFPAPALAQATVGSAEIIDGSIQSVDLADGAVTAADLSPQASIPPAAVGRIDSLQLSPSAVDGITLGPVDGRAERTTATVPEHGFGISTAACRDHSVPAGRVLSGGWRTLHEGMRIMASAPAFPENGGNSKLEWVVIGHIEAGNASSITPEATCLR